MKNNYLAETLIDLALITKKVQTEFGTLSVAQLNWQSAADKWSIAQCLDHLIKTNEQYFPLLIGVATGNRKRSVWERLPLLPGLIGKLMQKSIHPDNLKPLKSPAIFKPATSSIPGNIVTNFSRHQEELINLIRATDSVNHQKTIVSSPLSALITFSLNDGIRILALHEERHLRQAQRVLHLTNFPQQMGAVI